MFCGLTSTEDEIVNTSFIIYPNPAKDHVTISHLPADNSILTISGMLGRKIKTLSTEGKATIDIDVSDLRKGIYLVTVGGLSKKLVVSHR